MVLLAAFSHSVVFSASHTAELGFVFDKPYGGAFPGAKVFTPEEAALARTVSGYWLQFARTGDPNPPDAATTWPKYSDQDEILRLQTASEGGVVVQSGLRKAPPLTKAELVERISSCVQCSDYAEMCPTCERLLAKKTAKMAEVEEEKLGAPGSARARLGAIFGARTRKSEGSSSA